MKQIIKFSFGSTETSVLIDGRRSKALWEELQLELNYIDHDENRINIHCNIPEEQEIFQMFYILYMVPFIKKMLRLHRRFSLKG